MALRLGLSKQCGCTNILSLSLKSVISIPNSNRLEYSNDPALIAPTPTLNGFHDSPVKFWAATADAIAESTGKALEMNDKDDKLKEVFEWPAKNKLSSWLLFKYCTEKNQEKQTRGQKKRQTKGSTTNQWNRETNKKER